MSHQGPDEGGGGGFGRRGWILVAAVVVSVLVAPGLVYLYAAVGRVGDGTDLPFLVAMLALPMLPAVLLGAAAVWSMTAAEAGAGPETAERLDTASDTGRDGNQ